MQRSIISTYNILLKWSNVLFGLILLITVSILLWASNKGLDVSDESFYLLNYRYPNLYHASFSTFHLIVDFFTFHHELTVQGYRLLYLTSIIAQTIIFALGFNRWIDASYSLTASKTMALCWNSRVVYCFLYFLIASLLCFSTCPRTFSYNSINSFTIYISAGLVLYSIILPDGSWARRAALFLVGVVISVGFFSKVSSAVIVLGVHILLLFIVRKKGFNSFVFNSFGSIMSGFVVACMVYFTCVQPFEDWIFNFTREMKLIVKTSYGTGQMIRNYSRNVLQACLFLISIGLPFLLACILISLRRKTAGQKHSVLSNGIILALLLLFAYLLVRSNVFDNGYYNHEAAVKVLLVFLVGTFLFCGAWQKAFWITLDKGVAAVILWLFVLPAAASYGTANSLLLNMAIDVTSWFAILLILANETLYRLGIDNKRLDKTQARASKSQGQMLIHAAILLALPAVYAFQQTVWGIIFRPYMLTETLLNQSQKVTLPGFKGDLWVDRKSQVFLNNTFSILSNNGFKSGNNIIVLHDMPGLVYFLGGISPNAPWYFSFSLPRNLHALSLNANNIKGSYLVLNKELTHEELASFRAHGILFPENYQLIGILENAYTGFNPTQTVVKFYRYNAQ